MTLYQTKTFSTGPKWLFILIFIFVVSCKDLKNEANDDPLAMEAPEEGFVPIFDGKTLEGWQGDPQYWRVENGNLVGEVTPSTLLKTNTFIIWQDGQSSDFELKLEFRIAEKGNSGVNYRSELVDSIPYALRGYQADIDGRNTYTGQNYEERKRTTLAYRGESTIINSPTGTEAMASLGANIKNNAWQNRDVVGSLGNIDSLKAKINSEAWNQCRLVVKGNRLQHYINGILMSEVIDNDTINAKSSGLLGLQVHVGPPMQVEYRNIELKQL
ncbi:MAG: DUF1080 domain-containing protein [Flavobacteriaceae bacterium]